MGMNNAFGHFLGAVCWVPNNALVLAKMNNWSSRKHDIIAMIEFDKILCHDILMNLDIVLQNIF
jgi:hypothetical protein